MKLNDFITQGDPIAIASGIGMKMMPMSGGKVSVICPSHKKMCGHEDRHLGSCYLTPKGYYCFSCGAKGNWLKMVADFYDMPFESFKEKLEVAKKVRDIVYPDVKLDGKQKNKDKISSPAYILSAEELKEIELFPYSNATKTVYNEFDHEREEYEASYSINSLYENDPFAYYYMVAEKTMAAINKATLEYEFVEGLSGTDTFWFSYPGKRNQKLDVLYNKIQKLYLIKDKINDAFEKDRATAKIKAA